ncbi:hypothetical protein GUJ93_ZPchr0011g28359 [Zizania palustris]|uniref:Uncharacterized protein n=1 Tax=Zizania palustris TaxID=103762 RepID=A0A8J5WGV3_ZIZPA|nr:hypothetical protein GUJ93_ZPchr0011g28359 [Zizania palustris]
MVLASADLVDGGVNLVPAATFGVDLVSGGADQGAWRGEGTKHDVRSVDGVAWSLRRAAWSGGEGTSLDRVNSVVEADVGGILLWKGHEFVVKEKLKAVDVFGDVEDWHVLHHSGLRWCHERETPLLSPSLFQLPYCK